MSAAGPPGLSNEGAKNAPLYASGAAVVLRAWAQPEPPQSLELVPEQVGVPTFAFVAKPEQLPERTSHVARKGYDERYA